MAMRIFLRIYSRTTLFSIISSISSIGRLDHSTWQILRDLGLNKSFRGCRAGIHKKRLITTLTGFGRNHHSYNQYKAYLLPIPNTCRIARNPNLIYISCYNNDTNDSSELLTDALKRTELNGKFLPNLVLNLYQDLFYRTQCL